MYNNKIGENMSYSKSISLILVLISIGTVGLTASPKTGPSIGGLTFEKLDINEDSKLSTKELLAYKKLRFDEKDSNGDGNLSNTEIMESQRVELEKRLIKQSTGMIKKLDKNSDGEISFIEFDEKRSERKGRNIFTLLDKNKDGLISIEEFALLKNRDKRNGRHRKNNN